MSIAVDGDTRGRKTSPAAGRVGQEEESERKRALTSEVEENWAREVCCVMSPNPKPSRVGPELPSRLDQRLGSDEMVATTTDWTKDRLAWEGSNWAKQPPRDGSKMGLSSPNVRGKSGLPSGLPVQRSKMKMGQQCGSVSSWTWVEE
ncbi:unnamed protein product [Linum trigynum]|uniref:Uncharacterized protein n=1 Tax=Linum trigynum TaxID=586398 RepID=A0AAV2EXA8_9ROSI